VNAGSAIDERISLVVAAHREEFAELIRQAIDREVAQLVDVELDVVLARLAELRANGTAPAAVEAPTTSLCSRCGERPRLPDRSLCRRCKTAGDVERRRRRRREQHDPPVADAEPPRTV
jgi:hypothetical protein